MTARMAMTSLPLPLNVVESFCRSAAARRSTPPFFEKTLVCQSAAVAICPCLCLIRRFRYRSRNIWMFLFAHEPKTQHSHQVTTRDALLDIRADYRRKTSDSTKKLHCQTTTMTTIW